MIMSSSNFISQVSVEYSRNLHARQNIGRPLLWGKLIREGGGMFGDFTKLESMWPKMTVCLPGELRQSPSLTEAIFLIHCHSSSGNVIKQRDGFFVNSPKGTLSRRWVKKTATSFAIHHSSEREAISFLPDKFLTLVEGKEKSLSGRQQRAAI